MFADPSLATTLMTVALAGLLFLPACGRGPSGAPSPTGKPSAGAASEPAREAARPGPNPVVVLDTTMGPITIELLPDKAPTTVRNILDYVDSGFYDGTIFHRVIPGFVIQGGGFTESFAGKPTRAPIRNEADNGLRNLRGTLSMARTQDVNSATSQFFINLADNAALDHSARGFGYCVFARVTAGMDVVDRIAAVRTGTRGQYGDVPVQAVVIRSARRVQAP